MLENENHYNIASIERLLNCFAHVKETNCLILILRHDLLLTFLAIISLLSILILVISKKVQRETHMTAFNKIMSYPSIRHQ